MVYIDEVTKKGLYTAEEVEKFAELRYILIDRRDGVIIKSMVGENPISKWILDNLKKAKEKYEEQVPEELKTRWNINLSNIEKLIEQTKTF